MIYTVTLNPSLDYHVHAAALCAGRLCRTQNERLFPGGKGINVSLVCAALGLQTRALGFIAGETGRLLDEMLSEIGLPHDFLHLEQGMTRINVKILSDAQTELNGSGPVIPEKSLEALAASLERLHVGDWLVLSGSAPAGVPAEVYARLLERAAGRGVHTLVDTSGQALRSALQLRPELIKPNLDELEELSGKAPRTPEGLAACARALQAQGARNILLSCGADGALLVPEKGRALYLSAPVGKTVQTVGSGDSMAAGYLYAASRQLSDAEALPPFASGCPAARKSKTPCCARRSRSPSAQFDSPPRVCYNKVNCQPVAPFQMPP